MPKKRNSVGSTLGSSQVYRGGGWIGVSGNCRSAIRRKVIPSDWSGVVGLRVVAVKRSRNGEKA